MPALPARLSVPALLGAAFALSATLAGCNLGGTKMTEFAPSCPTVKIRADAADITRYREGSSGRDLTDLVLDGRITGFKGGCSRENAKTVRSVVNVDLVLARGPATRGRVLSATYWIAVLDGEQIVDKQEFPLRVELGPNQDQARLSSGDVVLMLPVNREKSAAAYDVLIGFQLTPEELETNRRRGAR